MAICKSTVSATMAAFAVGALLAVSPATAQPSDGWGRDMMMGPGMMGWRGMGRYICDPRAAGLAEWRVNRIERSVRPTDAQRPALEELRAASKKAAEVVSGACPRELPVSPVARLEAMEKRLEAMLQAVKTVRPAFEAFYASLDDEQKARLSAVGPRGWGWRRWRTP